MIVLLPLIPVSIPPNGHMIIVAFIDVACFDLIPVDLFYPYLFDFQDSDAFNF